MRLLGCHIDNFGAFHNYDLTFNDGLNVIMQANGWGKTTLAAFMKAMLYGFDGKRVRKVAENERLRYRPWQGGKYGGSLDFEANGREYRVIRTFGATGARDNVRIVYIDTGKSALSETGPNVGEWLFGLDANAFQKSVYVVQNGLVLDTSMASLRNRLNSLVNEADDVAGFDKAQARLEERRKHYKKTGNRGAIADISKDIARLVDADARSDARIAELRSIDGEIAACDSSMEELDKRIAEAQEMAREDQEAEQRGRALKRVSDQLRERLQAAETAYDKATKEAGGGSLDDLTVSKTRQEISELKRLETDADAARASADAADEKRSQVAKGYPNGLPKRQELREMRDALTELASREEALRASRPAGDKSTAWLSAAAAADPTLADRSEAAIARLDDVNETVEAGRAAQDELRSARARWDERRRAVLQLASESAERSEALPDDAEEQIAELRGDARDLRSATAELATMDVRLETLRTQVSDEQKKLDSLQGGSAVGEAESGKLEEQAVEVASAAESANRARETRDERVAEAEELRRRVKEAENRLAEQKAAAEQSKPTTPTVPIACFAAAAIAVVAGIATGALVALLAIGVVLAAVGVVLLMRGRPEAPAGPDPEMARAASDASDAYAKARQEAESAERHLADAEERHRDASESLTTLVGELFPDETFDSATIAAQVPILRQRLNARAEQEKKVRDLRDRLDAAEAEAEEARARADAIVARHPDLPGDEYGSLASAMDERAMELENLQRDALSSRKRLLDAVSEDSAGYAVPADGSDLEGIVKAFEQEEAPEAARLLESERQAALVAEEYAAELSGLLGAFGLDGVEADSISVGAERLSKAVSTYREEEARKQASEQELRAREADIALARAELDKWAHDMGKHGADDLTDGWFAAAEEAISADERAAWEEKRARRKADDSRNAAEKLRGGLLSFFASHGVEHPEDMDVELDALSKRASEVSNLRKARDLASAELSQWMSKNRDAVEAAEARAKGPQARADASRQLDQLRQLRDSLVRQKAQCEEQRSAVLQSLEGRLVAHQELALLSKKKQRAATNLFTVQKTAEYLLSAREGLDGRYLGDLTDRFSDYANAWLDGEGIEARVSPDFNVAISEGSKAHDVAGYSTGYQDLLDICFRMALVDTVFQAEPPFLIMDDPFSSLDEDKIRKAFMLIATLSSKYQVIYFTCHPSRTEEGVTGEASAAFVLPEQQARRELPRARAKREAEERAKAQAELVASYAVVPVARGRASIAPAGKRHSISSNLFNVSFVVDESNGSRDNSFEVHFIDSKGRALCDRQSVEVIGGHAVPDKVRFSLTTRDDSGDTYDMIVHENGREPAELAARIPFRAEVSFASDDFGF